MTKQQYTQSRLAGILSFQRDRQARTIERLREAISALEARGEAVSADSIWRECGMYHRVYARNPEALALFHAHSTEILKYPAKARRAPTDSSISVMQRLQAAIASLETQGQPVTLRSIRSECGLTYQEIAQEPSALALFREHSAGLKARQGNAGQRQQRDPLLYLKKSELVALIMRERVQHAQLEQQYAALLQQQASTQG